MNQQQKLQQQQSGMQHPTNTYQGNVNQKGYNATNMLKNGQYEQPTYQQQGYYVNKPTSQGNGQVNNLNDHNDNESEEVGFCAKLGCC